MPILPVLLLLAAVILVNGWTDAPNAIAAPVAAGVLPFRRAAALAAVCNLLGVVCSVGFSDAVARTLYTLADFGPYALPALTAALAATVLWAVLAWALWKYRGGKKELFAERLAAQTAQEAGGKEE